MKCRKCYESQEEIPENSATKTVISSKAGTGLYYSLYVRCLVINLQWVNKYNLFLKEFSSPQYGGVETPNRSPWMNYKIFFRNATLSWKQSKESSDAKNTVKVGIHRAVRSTFSRESF